jgi:phosphoglucosamine mutase
VRGYFGTDGVRGVAGVDLTEELVRRLGAAFARWSGRAEVLVGRDTRASGPGLEEALAAGLAAGGSPVVLGGVLPTPAVALLASGCGAVVSASHNPAEYNGVKLFAGAGRKLSEVEEEQIEALVEGEAGGETASVETAGVETAEGLGERYVELVCERFGAPLEGLRVAVDCANGAMFEVAPAALERLGANVVLLAAEPDGTNINAGCGATDLSLLSRVAREETVDFGVAFDGDGDRVLGVDGEGRELDGDAILAVLALHLGVDLVVVTQMTNLGFHRLMDEREIRVATTDVGDRHVLEALRREGGILGGEQSGHVIYLGGHTTGDGLVAAILLARAVVETGRPLGELAAVYEPLPQAKENVRVRSREMTPALAAQISAAERALGKAGRVVVRPSGTEPVVRVLVEAETPQMASNACATIAAHVRHELG